VVPEVLLPRVFPKLFPEWRSQECGLRCVYPLGAPLRGYQIGPQVGIAPEEDPASGLPRVGSQELVPLRGPIRGWPP
jgi:hypothetical protein